MDEGWPQIKEIVGSALELGPEQRMDFVRKACGDNEALRREVESLLACDQEADRILENSPSDDVFSIVEPSMIGRRVGNYRIIRETGQGGMAVVYVAERDDREFQRRVAIKMVKPSANGEEILRRFRNERQMLAGLDHPNIVKLLDGGTTEEGRPYLVMEFVEGSPIDKYCDARRLTVTERLRLFRIVCAAVQYAHTHQVIHRDLKPSNVIITEDGVPRLLDFGIAKVLAPETLPGQASTIGQWRPMTPDYASPEQVRGKGVTYATDIYSLGVLLYELLTGHRPYQTTSESWAEIERVVREEVPGKPSVVIKKPGGCICPKELLETAPQHIADVRRVTVEQLGRSLKGDLDTIVLMALRKEPERRYASVADLSGDIDRYLAGLPVRARKPTVGYRSGKFLRRHQEAVTTVAVIILLLVVVLGWQGPKLWKNRTADAGPMPAQARSRPSIAVLGFKNLSGQRNAAWISTALSEMLTTEFAAGENLRIVPGEVVSRAKIELALPEEESLSPETLRRVGSNLGNDFVVSGSYLYTGNDEIRIDLTLQDVSKGETISVVSETGKPGNLTELVSRSGARLRSKLGILAVSPFETSGLEASFPSTPEAMKAYSEGLVKLRSFDALVARGLFTRAVAADPNFPLAHLALARTYQTLGYDAKAMEESKRAMDLSEKLSRQDYLQVEARYFESIRNWDKTIETYRALSTFFPDNLEYGLNLARAQTLAGKGKEALSTLTALEAWSTQNREDPRIDLARSEAASSLGDNRLRRDAAESAANKAAREGAKLLVARARTYECRALANLGENEKARYVCEEGKRIYLEAGDRGGLARILHAMAEVPLNQGDLPAAEKLYREALTLTREIGDKQGIGRESGNLALTYKYRGDFATAGKLMQDALRNQEEVGDKNGMAIQTGNIGNVLRLQGKLAEALHYYQRSLTLSNEVGNKSSAAIAMVDIGETLVLKGDLGGAVRSFQQAVTVHQERGEKFYYAGALDALAGALRLQGDLGNARSNYLEALATQQLIGEKDGTAETRLALARLELDSGNAREAESLIRAALPTFQELNESDDQIAAQGLLARVLADQGRILEARESVAAGVQLVEKSNNAMVRMPFILDRAYVLAAEKEFSIAEKLVGEVVDEARRLGTVPFQLEAALAAAEILAKEKGLTAGRGRLREVERSARKAGFGLIAQKTAAAQK